MTATISLLLDEPDTNEFIADDWETTELPVPVTDQATATAEPPATATPPENSPNNHSPAIEALRWVGDLPKYEYDPNAEPLYVRTRPPAARAQMVYITEVSARSVRLTPRAGPKPLLEQVLPNVSNIEEYLCVRVRS